MLQRAQLESAHSLILQRAESVYGALWQEMNRWITEAQQRGIDVQTNGSPYEKSIMLPVRSNPPQALAGSRTLTLTLKKDEHAIMIDGLKNPLGLRLEVFADNTVGLERDGIEISIHDAAILILDPFLFPEFAKISPASHASDSKA